MRGMVAKVSTSPLELDPRLCNFHIDYRLHFNTDEYWRARQHGSDKESKV
jgi:hypothetical protein